MICEIITERVILLEKLIKEKIASTLEALLETKSFEKITVQNIVDESGISKSTFYRHFSDKYDVMLYEFTRKLDANANIYLNNSEHLLSESCKDFSAFLYSKRNLFSKVIKVDGQNSFEKAFTRIFYKINLRLFEFERELSQEEKDLLLLYSIGSAGFLCHWAANGFKESPEYTAKITFESYPEPLKKYI